MITHIRMKNFKSWKDSGEVKLAPLTGFFGTNSSGKSSLLQMLLLLKQTTENKDADEAIYFGDNQSLINLGEYKEVIHGHIKEGVLEFEFGCKLHDPLIIAYHINFQEEKIKTYSFTFNTSIQEKFSNLLVPYLSYTINDPMNLKIFWTEKEIYYEELDTGNFINTHKDSRQKNCYGVVLPQQNPLLFNFTSAFENVLSDVYYLGPTRVNPRRNYNWDGKHPVNPNQWGNETIDALLSARIRKLTTIHKQEKVEIEQRVSDWLQKMDLAHSFSLDWKEVQDGKSYEVRIQKTSSSPPVTLVDMGYGLSQFLPVLVLCYYVPEGSTLILEQPGIHLHPKVQSQLADLLIEVVNERKLQILVESHSEHLLTRIQRRIVEKQIESNDVALYFCRNDGGASTIDKLDVDEESGDIKNWPENFFGDVMGDMFAMTDKQVERIAENEPEE